MPTFIYLYGTGESSSGDKNNCFLKCEIPSSANIKTSGFMPSVLHSYIMYAKDIGLVISDIVIESETLEVTAQTQLVYSLWPLLYVNNSATFTDGRQPGINVWSNNNQELILQYTVQLDTDYAFYYRADPTTATPPNLNAATETANAIPAAGTVVQSQTPWSMTLNIPDNSDTGNASTFTIIKHYNQLVIWDTLLDMDRSVNLVQSVNGLKEAMGKVLQAVVNRKYSYDAIVPKWSSSWGNKPEYYDHMRNDMNNFNIGASLYVYQHDQDPNDENTTLNLLGTALNIKGQIKAGHAETRLLLTLDALNVYMDDRVWYTDVTNFFQFNEQVNIVRITQFYEGKHVALLSSLKPCYLCVGETEASSEGFIKTINNAPVNMWASFPYIPSNPVVKEVLYFDIDEPIDYASSIFVTWNGEVPFNWHLTLAPWNEWTALWHQQRDSLTALSYPSGPRVIAPAGECLKTGYSYLRYLNSAKLLCTPQREYLAKMTQWTTGNVQDTEL